MSCACQRGPAGEEVEEALLKRLLAAHLHEVDAARGALAGEVVARWLGDPSYLDADQQPRALSRGLVPAGFDALVQAISSDVRPRAVLDELLRLGVVELDETGAEVRLRAAGFGPLAEWARAYLEAQEKGSNAPSQNPTFASGISSQL